MVEATACCRVDLAGGTLDIWPLNQLHPEGCTVNMAVDIPVRVRMEEHPSEFRVIQGGEVLTGKRAGDLRGHPGSALIGLIAEALKLPPVEIHLESGSPRGGGLGASSSMAVALIAAGEALLGRAPSPVERKAAVARDLEARLMQLPTGTQDHWAALLGGALQITYPAGGVQARRLEVDLEALGDCLVVAYTGQSHFSAGSNWQVVRRRLDGEPESVELFTGIAETSRDLAASLSAGDLPRTGTLMAQEWSFRSRLAEGISTPVIEKLLAAARDRGAWGGKACGAGGGGCIAILAPPEKRQGVVDTLAKAGGEILPARPSSIPLTVK